MMAAYSAYVKSVGKFDMKKGCPAEGLAAKKSVLKVCFLKILTISEQLFAAWRGVSFTLELYFKH